eukprot:SAG22_NODE_10133_length_551_cov_1.030973_1_plen_37_part_10
MLQKRELLTCMHSLSSCEACYTAIDEVLPSNRNIQKS